jgi:hypothetical protein
MWYVRKLLSCTARQASADDAYIHGCREKCQECVSGCITQMCMLWKFSTPCFVGSLQLCNIIGAGEGVKIKRNLNLFPFANYSSAASVHGEPACPARTGIRVNIPQYVLYISSGCTLQRERTRWRRSVTWTVRGLGSVRWGYLTVYYLSPAIHLLRNRPKSDTCLYECSDHKDLGNHLLQLCPKVMKHPVCHKSECMYVCVCVCVYVPA